MAFIWILHKRRAMGLRWIQSLWPKNSDFTIKGTRAFFMECFWLSGHILQTVRIMAQTVRIMAIIRTVCAIIRTVCAIIHTVCKMCPDSQKHSMKNARILFIVKSEFLGYNAKWQWADVEKVDVLLGTPPNPTSIDPLRYSNPRVKQASPLRKRGVC